MWSSLALMPSLTQVVSSNAASVRDSVRLRVGGGPSRQTEPLILDLQSLWSRHPSPVIQCDTVLGVLHVQNKVARFYDWR